jgi:hypothetical protein
LQVTEWKKYFSIYLDLVKFFIVVFNFIVD